jgi:hypothetical protein
MTSEARGSPAYAWPPNGFRLNASKETDDLHVQTVENWNIADIFIRSEAKLES